MADSRFEVSKKAIVRENIPSELEALSERIDVMYLVGGKFTDNEYMDLVDLIESQMTVLTSDNRTANYMEKISNETV